MNAELERQEYRRLLFMAKYRLSEAIGFVKATQPNNKEYLRLLEVDRDEIARFLTLTRR